MSSSNPIYLMNEIDFIFLDFWFIFKMDSSEVNLSVFSSDNLKAMIRNAVLYFFFLSKERSDYNWVYSFSKFVSWVYHFPYYSSLFSVHPSDVKFFTKYVNSMKVHWALIINLENFLCQNQNTGMCINYCL